MKRLFLSAAVKKMLVRLVSTLITSSESCGNSSRVRGVGDGDANAEAPGELLVLRKQTAARHSCAQKSENEKQQQ